MVSSAATAPGALAFEVLAEISSGATARVDLARVQPPDPRAGTLLAVKRLHSHIAEDPSFANQFLDEVWMTASLRHPNVVEVAGWGTDSQGAYLAVELVQGVSLARLMKTVFETGEVFTERMVVFFASRLARGLAAAHALRAPNGEHLNLVHRDLTPSNVLVGFNGDVKIADFGLAKAKQRLTKTLTGMRKGEPTYMAPEQALADNIDGRADLFSFGVMLFELFAGRRPWIAKSDLEMVQLSTRDPPADLRALRPKIDKELVAVVNRCLEKDPANRFQSAAEVAARFDEWLEVHGYNEGNEEALARFVRRNAMRQMRWFERAVSGELLAQPPPRELPRVPTYTENTGRPREDSDEHPPQESEARPIERSPVPAPAVPGAGPRLPRPTVPARPVIGSPGVPRPPAADPRTARAQAVVQQLKKLAPAAPVKKRAPNLDDENEITDVENRVAAQQRGPLPRIASAELLDDDEGEGEIPTLVQSTRGTIEAVRAATRGAAEARAQRGQAIADDDSEDSENRVTEKRHIPDGDDAPTRPKGQRVEGQSPSPPRALPPGQSIPRMPAIPGGARGPARAPQATPPPSPARPMSEVLKTESAPLRPQSPAAPHHHHQDPQGAGSETARLKETMEAQRALRPSEDDVEILDRGALQAGAQGRSTSGLLTPDALVAEADRMAIEAVRSNEEARTAQQRAERRAVMARMAQEAAMIASEAVSLIHTAGMPAALKKLEEARAIEAALQSGKLGTADHSGPQRVPQDLLVRSSPPSPSVPAPSSAPQYLGAAQESSPPGEGYRVSSQSFAHTPAPNAVHSSQLPVPTFQSTAPPAPSNPPPALAFPTDPLPIPVQRAPMAAPPAAPMMSTSATGLPMGMDDFEARLQPKILGVPVKKAVIIGGGILVLVVIFILALTH